MPHLWKFKTQSTEKNVLYMGRIEHQFDLRVNMVNFYLSFVKSFSTSSSCLSWLSLLVSWFRRHHEGSLYLVSCRENKIQWVYGSHKNAIFCFILLSVWHNRTSGYMTTTRLGTSTTFEIQNSFVLRVLVPPCCWPVEKDAMQMLLL